MASKTCNQPSARGIDAYTSDTWDPFPISPGEPGKFDFYRIHLINHGHYSDPTLAEKSNESVPTFSATKSSSTSMEKQPWSLFTDFLSCHQSNAPTLTSSQSSHSISTNKSDQILSPNSNTSSHANGMQKEPSQSLTSLTSTVTTALNTGSVSTNSNQNRRPYTGITLSSKDLNHLSPQSM